MRRRRITKMERGTHHSSSSVMKGECLPKPFFNGRFIITGTKWQFITFDNFTDWNDENEEPYFIFSLII